jgi:hypothetical protein
MAVGLSQFRSAPLEPPIVLEMSELAAAATLAPHRDVVVRVHTDELDEESGRLLSQLGFEPVPDGYSQTIDLSGIGSEHDLVERLTNKYFRRKIRRYVKDNPSNLHIEMTRLGEGSEAKIGEFFEQAIIPAAVSMGINPFGLLHGARYPTLVSWFARSAEPPRLITVYRDGACVGSLFITVSAGLPWTPSGPIEARWSGPAIGRHDRFVRLHVGNPRPGTGIESEVTIALYCEGLRWCLREGVRFCSFAFGEGWYRDNPGFRGGYLKLVGYKKLWEPQLLVWSSVRERTFLRLSRPSVFAQRDTAMYCRLGRTPDEAPALVYVLGAALDGPTERILAADRDWRIELEVPNPHRAGEVAAACERLGLAAPIRVWQDGACSS